ncbi:probable E3 ubiquitin-protein ligase RHB1A isoform X1 [Dioscorea cayenensis subsp. rotundata]|uniref:RING-type E3 ubiquitin transferase n=1 Tax=Dioscorea cayennensis subsp. rotundata TaxID=55577 RepID=A0AB40CIT8_DIOCR|nr:probable E3 ubiquitin-protein ligase RHB1A isoform X1 [Dioscorea cayenensis subsp. rotundata]
MGCCCSRRAEINRAPIYVYCPQTSDGGPLSSANGPASSVPASVLVDTNLDTSIPDTFRAPPAPLPYDVGLTHAQTLPSSFGNSGNKTDHVQPADSLSLGEAVSGGTSEGLATAESLKGSVLKSTSDDAHDSAKIAEDEPSKFCEPVSSAVDEEDVCPICLEEYDLENPRILTKCEHHYHLACILEWMERSDTCPVCDQIMVFDQTLYE